MWQSPVGISNSLGLCLGQVIVSNSVAWKQVNGGGVRGRWGKLERLLSHGTPIAMRSWVCAVLDHELRDASLACFVAIIHPECVK